MKKVNKIWMGVVAVLLLLSGSVYAQNKDSRGALRLGIGIEAGAPTQNFSNFLLGGTARLQYDLAQSTSLTLTSGYYNLFAKNIVLNNVKYEGQDIGIVPIKLGAKFFIAPNFYIHPEAGAALSVRSQQEGKLYAYNKGAQIDAAAGIGYATDAGIDISLRYEQFFKNDKKDIPNLGFVGLRVAYAWKLL